MQGWSDLAKDGSPPPFLWELLQEAICSGALWEMEKVALALALLFFGNSCKRQSAQVHFGKWRRWPWPWPSFSLGTLARGNLLRCTLGNGEGGLGLGPPFLWELLQEAICSDALWEMEKVALALALLFFGNSCKRQSAQMHFGKWRRWPCITSCVQQLQQGFIQGGRRLWLH